MYFGSRLGCFSLLLPWQLKIIPVNSKNDEHKEKFFLYKNNKQH